MYLDPGFGSMIVQVIVAAIAACGVVLYSIRRKLRSIFKRGKQGSEQEMEQDQGTATGNETEPEQVAGTEQETEQGHDS